jgi:hypothetical protein
MDAVRNMVNTRARERYADFKAAMTILQGYLDDEIKSLIGRVDEGSFPEGAWSLPSVDDLNGLRERAMSALEVLNKEAARYEAELISREWRV